MLGFMKKDLFMIRANTKVVLIFGLIVFMLSVQGQESGMSAIAAAISVMLFVSTFSYDEYNKWNAYAVTLPNGRKNAVKSKYFATLIFAAVVITVIGGISAAAEFYRNRAVDWNAVLDGLLAAFFVVGLLVSVMYPLIFRFGAETGRIVMFVGVFFISAVIGVLSAYINYEGVWQILSFAAPFVQSYGRALLAGLTLVMLYASYGISKSVYRKKEF